MSTLTLSISEMNQLADALENAGFSLRDVTTLKQCPDLDKVLDFLCGRAEITAIPRQKILEFTKKIVIQLPKGEFIARDHFTEDKFDMGSNFREWFLGVVETHNGEEVEIKIHKLTKASVDNDIITDLGGEGVVETSFASLIGLMPHLAKNQWYLFYIRDVNGELRAVNMSRRGGGWYVDASSVVLPLGGVLTIGWSLVISET